MIMQQIKTREILCFGDSNTYGLIPGTKNRYDRSIRWTGLLQDALYKKGYCIAEEGLCGRTTVFEDELRYGRKGSDTLPVLLESHSPVERVILMLGTNDCKTYYNASAEVIGRGVERLIRQIKSISPDTKVLLISPIWLGEQVWEPEFDPEFDQRSVETSHQLKAVYERIAKKYGLDFLAASDFAVPSEEDREHLDPANHRKLADAILSKLDQIAIV